MIGQRHQNPAWGEVGHLILGLSDKAGIRDGQVSRQHPTQSESKVASASMGLLAISTFAFAGLLARVRFYRAIYRRLDCRAYRYLQTPQCCREMRLPANLSLLSLKLPLHRRATQISYSFCFLTQGHRTRMLRFTCTETFHYPVLK